MIRIPRLSLFLGVVAVLVAPAAATAQAHRDAPGRPAHVVTSQRHVAAEAPHVHAAPVHVATPTHDRPPHYRLDDPFAREAALQAGDARRAVATAERAVRRSPRGEGVFALTAASDALARGEWLLSAGRLAEACGYFSSASQHARDAVADVERAEREHERLWAQFRRLDAEVAALLSAARAYYRPGAPTAVDAYADEAVGAQAEGAWRARAGDLAAAVASMDRAARLARRAADLAVAARLRVPPF